MISSIGLKELFEFQMIYGKDSTHNYIDKLLNEYKKTVSFPYKCDFGRVSVVILEDGTIQQP